jgi:hypothetical protein
MKTITFNIFKFDELSDESKKNAIKEIQKSTLLESDQEISYNDFTINTQYELKNLKFEDVRLEYSLSYCQGDGLCFTGCIYLSDLIKLEEFKKYSNEKELKNITRILKVCDPKIEIKKRNNHYTHNRTVYFEHDFYNAKSKNSKIENLLDHVLDQNFKYSYMNITDKYEKEGYSIQEYYWNDSNVIEYITNYDIDFLENGKIYFE